MMEEAVINKVQAFLRAEKMTRKSLYENLLAEGVVKPNSEKCFYELLEYALDEGIISSNKIIKFKKKKGKLPEIFSTDQLIKMFDEVDRPKLGVCMWLGFFCGLRIREICNLRVEEVDLNNKVIFVKDSKNTNRRKEGYGKDRVVSVPDIAINPLMKWLEIIQGGEWFIPSMQDSNKNIRTKTIHEQFRFLLNRCGLSKGDYVTEYRGRNHGKKKDLKKTTYRFRFHTLRHTYASYLLDKGVPLENIQRALGHNQLETTLIYAKVKDSTTKKFINDAFSVSKRFAVKDSSFNAQTGREGAVGQHLKEVLGAEEVLKVRLAKGEIDLLTYKRLLAEINPENTVNVLIKR